MEIQVIDREEDFFDLRPEWNAVLEQSQEAKPFLLHEWLWAWWKAFGGNSHLQVVRFHESGRTVAFVPLRLTRITQFGIPLRALSFLANAHSNETGFVSNSAGPLVFLEFLHFLRENQRAWDLVLLELLRESGPFVRFVQETPEMDHFFWGTKPSIGSPVVELPDTVDAYLNDLSRKSRYNVRKKKRKLEENFGFEIRPFFDVWQLNEFWQHMEEIERNSWKFKVGKDLVSHPEVKDFYSRLLQAMASKGLFRGFILFVEKKPVAYEMAFEFQNQLFSQKIAYDASWAHTSAGFVLKTEVIRWAIEKGLTHNHLLGDEEPWKVQLNGRLQPHVHLKIYAPGFRSKVVAKAEFEGIKKLGKIKHSLIEMKRILL